MHGNLFASSNWNSRFSGTSVPLVVLYLLYLFCHLINISIFGFPELSCCSQPTSECSTESVQGLAKKTNLGGIGDVTLRLFHVDQFLKVTMEERCFYIHLVDVPLLFSGKCDDVSQRLVFDYRGKSFLVINTFRLSVALGNQAGLIAVNSPIKFSFNFENLAVSDDRFVARSGNQFPGVHCGK